MSDWLYPFYYRTKGYMVIIGLSNFFLALAGVYISAKVKEEEISPLIYFIFMMLIYMCLAGVDAICRNSV